ncbi:hypothetical protein J2Z21_006068 [Streptomyces griseochromogenes]|uniref:Uncharacterized protein n=1 Tax=Streptomyces griseochromogenes TaxID=68214 RepID=A0ABS4M087_9ACTN|nr:hypothetical protein [Streptomyces griseochromogenes]MBP2053077.1 hypothetical protein [Streptomyces griseochromogenes]
MRAFAHTFLWTMVLTLLAVCVTLPLPPRPGERGAPSEWQVTGRRLSVTA